MMLKLGVRSSSYSSMYSGHSGTKYGVVDSMGGDVVVGSGVVIFGVGVTGKKMH